MLNHSRLLRIRSVRRSISEDGVTTHDAIIVNENDAVVVQLKGLQLKGMAPLTDDQLFYVYRCLRCQNGSQCLTPLHEPIFIDIEVGIFCSLLPDSKNS